jgi:hypothetical protein
VYIDSRQVSPRHICILAFVMGNDSAGLAWISTEADSPNI